MHSYSIPKQADDGDQNAMIHITKAGLTPSLSDIQLHDPTSWQIIQEAIHNIQTDILVEDLFPDHEPDVFAKFLSDAFLHAVRLLQGNTVYSKSEKERMSVRRNHYISGGNINYFKFMNVLVSLGDICACSLSIIYLVIQIRDSIYRIRTGLKDVARMLVMDEYDLRRFTRANDKPGLLEEIDWLLKGDRYVNKVSNWICLYFFLVSDPYLQNLRRDKPKGALAFQRRLTFEMTERYIQLRRPTNRFRRHVLNTAPNAAGPESLFTSPYLAALYTAVKLSILY